LIGSLCDTEPRSDGYVVHRLRKRVNGTSPVEELAVPVSLYPQLISYLPPSFAETLRATGRATVVEGEHRKVNIIFINLQGVNEVLVESGPEVLMAEIQRYIAILVQLW
jgi:hypothetical protein